MQPSKTSVSDLFNFEGKVVVVTGAGSGLGKGIAKRFAEAGATIAICYNNSEEGALKLLEEISTLNSNANKSKIFKCDVTNPDQVKELIESVGNSLGTIDVLINNAGIYPCHDILEMTLDNWNSVVNANLTSTFLMTQAVAKFIKLKGNGSAKNVVCSIVNISSIESINPASGHAHYNVSKAGVDMLSKSNANELAQYGIRVNTVNPGVIEAPGIFENWDGAQRYTDKSPLKRIGQPDDVADACLFFASPASRWITGASLLVDGGLFTTTYY